MAVIRRDEQRREAGLVRGFDLRAVGEECVQCVRVAG